MYNILHTVDIAVHMGIAKSNIWQDQSAFQHPYFCGIVCPSDFALLRIPLHNIYNKIRHYIMAYDQYNELKF